MKVCKLPVSFFRTWKPEGCKSRLV